MTDDRDPLLQSLFANAEQDFSGEAFTAQVMSRTDRLKRRAIIGRVCVGLVLASCVWLLGVPLQDGVDLLTQGLTLPLIELDDGWLAQIFSPVNRIASLAALGLIGLRAAYRKISSRV